ncbi:MAG: hypothetical protein F4017_03385, partial [Acidimicrobiaceae bacterium]|nr:hypothetical protein [Acidimicrobiaceae bacterium]
MNRRQWRQPAARAAALAVAASMALAATPGAIGSEAGAAAGETDTSSAPGPCDEGWTAPAPTAVPVTAVPIEVASTTDDYFVLYV